MGKQKGLTTKQFVEKFSGAPWDHDNCAGAALVVTDGDIAAKAKAFLDAKEAFDKALEAAGFEWG